MKGDPCLSSAIFDDLYVPAERSKPFLIRNLSGDEKGGPINAAEMRVTELIRTPPFSPFRNKALSEPLRPFNVRVRQDLNRSALRVTGKVSDQKRF
jgi:hypothetical protein